MSTRNVTMVVNHKHYEDFTERMMDITPHSMAEYSKVNMYLHHDGYPEWQGVQLANWVKANPYQDSARVVAKLVHMAHRYKDVALKLVAMLRLVHFRK